MAKRKKSPAIERRKKAEKILLEARRLAERGWIKKGRESTAYMLMDCLEEAFVKVSEGRHLFGYHAFTPPELGMAMGALCRVTFRSNDPGTNAGRYRQLYNQTGTAYMVAHGGVFETYRKAVNLIRDDIKALREKADG